MAASFPKYFSLSVSLDSTSYRFMEIVHEDVVSHGLFIAKGEQIPNPHSKLELVDAGSGRVHIRCCFNNKYMAIRSETDHRISPVATEQVEDQSAWSCTLFRVSSIQSTGRTTLEHVHLGRRLVAREPDRILMIDDQDQTGFDFAVHDVSSMLALKLPQFFKLKTRTDTGNYGWVYADPSSPVPYINFITVPGNDVDPLTSVFEILPVDVGLFRIRSLSHNSCWRATPMDASPNIIRKHVHVDTSADLANLPADHAWSDGFFNIHRIGNNDDDNFVALSYYDSDSGKSIYLHNVYVLVASSTTNPNNNLDATFVMETPVVSTSIYNVRYNILAARLLTGNPESMSTQTVSNSGTYPATFDRTFTYTETTTTSWNAIVSASLGVSATISAGIPLFANGSVTTSWEISGAYEWGKEHTKTVTMEDSITVTAPPNTIISMSRWESKGSYDIPFSYTREDILYNGKRVVSERHDGIAIGINTHNIFYNIVETPMAPSTKGQETREYRIVPQTSRIIVPSLAAPPAAAAE